MGTIEWAILQTTLGFKGEWVVFFLSAALSDSSIDKVHQSKLAWDGESCPVSLRLPMNQAFCD